jgi:HEAT repeat protein
MNRSWSLLILTCCTLSFSAIADGGNSERTRELVAVLQSPSGTLFEKARACQQLGEIGDKSAVPALAAQLSDEHLSAYARSGLEGIHDPASAQALRASLNRLKGDLLAGAIESLGVLRDSQAVSLLKAFVADQNSSIARAAVLALGRIDSGDSITILCSALKSESEATRADAAAGILLAAEKQLADGHDAMALNLYDQVLKAAVPSVYLGAAIRGAILSHKSDRVNFLIQQLNSQDSIIRNAALLTMREISGPAVANALNAQIDKAPRDLQLQLLNAETDYHNEKSFKLLESKATGNDSEIRLRSLKVLSSIADPSEARFFLKILEANQSGAESDIAESALERLDGPGVDDSILKSLVAAPDARARVHLIGLLETRSATSSVPELMKQAAGPDEAVDVAALEALGALAGSAETRALIALAKTCKTEQTRDAAEKAIGRAVARNGDTNVAGAVMLEELKLSTDTVEKNSSMRVLADLGYSPALPAIESALTDADETIAANAVESLRFWPDPAPVDALLRLVDSASDASVRRRALASVIQLTTVAADERQRPEAIIVGWLGRASAAAQTDAERRQIIAVLGRLKRVESFRLLQLWLDQPELQAEASIAIVQIAPALVGGDDSATVKRALEKIASTSKNQETRDQATKLAASIGNPSAPAGRQ